MNCSSTLPSIFLFIGALVLCALCAFLETTITALRLFKIKELRERVQNRYQAILQLLEDNPNYLLNTMLIANNFANVLAATSGTFIIEQLLCFMPETLRFFVSLCCITAIMLIIGEIIPKNLAKEYGEDILGSWLWMIHLFYIPCKPIVNFLSRITDNLLPRLVGTNAHKEALSEKEIKHLIDECSEKGNIEPEKLFMLRRIFKLGNTLVKDIMVPMSSTIMLSANMPLHKAYNQFLTHQFSRLPVYDGSIENVIGMAYLKDLMSHQVKSGTVRELLRPIIYIPETVKVNQLLKEFKQKHMHMAIVINEHGSVIGLVTFEDVLEEIVGEIHDEYETVPEDIILMKPGQWLLDGRLELAKFEDFFQLSCKRESASTLSGFLTEHLQHIPKKGEHITYQGYTFTVHEVTTKHIQRVMLTQQKLDLIEREN